MTPKELDTILFTEVVSDIVAASMATFVSIEMMDEWKEWLRSRILTSMEDDPDGRHMYQMIAKMPDDIVASTIHIFLDNAQTNLELKSTIMKGLENG